MLTLEATAGQASGFSISRIVGDPADYDGIEVDGTYSEAPSLAPGVRASAQAAATNAVANWSRSAGVNVRVVTGMNAPALTVATRSNDFAPFNAGDYMRSNTSPSFAVCSTGFAIVYGGTNHTTTARHCNRSDWVARDNVYMSYGHPLVTTAGSAGLVLSATGSPLMFDGAWNNAAGYKKTVKGFTDIGRGAYVCDSGGNSGVHCGLWVYNMWDSINDGYGWVTAIDAQATNSPAIAVAGGDSGGPVFIPNADGTTVR
jgi:hypothetical protein